MFIARTVCMQSLGIDLSTDPAKVWLCEIDWGAAIPRVVALDQATTLVDPRPERAAAEALVRDETGLIAALVARLAEFEPSAERVVGVNVPFGWPVAFVDAISDWESGDLRGFRKRAELRLRAADRFTQAVSGITPMSVSTDRMGSTAMVWAEVLSRHARLLDQPTADRARARDGLAEVYPSTALRMWTDEGGEPFPFDRYKSSVEAREGLIPLLTGISAEAPPFQDPQRGAAGVEVPPEFRTALFEFDDALDAFLNALIARAVAVGTCFSVDGAIATEQVWSKDASPAGVVRVADATERARALLTEALETAESEGWIHVPQAGPIRAGLRGRAAAEAPAAA